MSSPPHIPRPALPLRGRDAAYRNLERRLAARGALVVLTGMGGVGKSRLAMALAQGWIQSARAACWVDLQATRHIEDLLVRVATSVGATRSDRIGRTLAQQPRLLLVLDNVEQLPDAAATIIAGWVREAASLRVLVTSRRRLRVPEEEAVEVVPLPTTGDAGVFATPAWQMLHDHAGEAITGLPEADAGRLLRATDGLPLALELAGARLEAMAPAELLERIDAPLALFVDPSRPGSRHGSLRLTLDWSWSLLAPADAAMLAQATVFRAPFTVDDAAAVLRGEAEPLDVLHRAVRSHLLVRETSAFRMLESTRAFAREQISEAEWSAAARRHALHFGAWAMAQWGPSPTPALPPPLQMELAAALDRCAGLGEEATFVGLHAGTVLADHARIRAGFEPVEGLVRRALELPATGHPDDGAVRAYLRCVQGIVQRGAGAYDAARDTYQTVLEQELPGWLDAWARNGLGITLALLGEVDDAIACLEHAATLPDVDPAYRVSITGYLSFVLSFAERTEEALALARQTVEASEDLPPSRHVMLAYQFASPAAAAGDDLELAELAAERAVALAREVGSASDVADQLGNRATMRNFRDDIGGALADLTVAVEKLTEHGHLSVAATYALDLARVLSGEGRWHDASDALVPRLDQLGHHERTEADAVLRLAAVFTGRAHEATLVQSAGAEVVTSLLRGFASTGSAIAEAADDARRGLEGCSAVRVHALWLRRVIDQLDRRARTWTIHPEGAWVQPPGDRERIELRRRKAYARVVAALLEARVGEGGEALDMPRLFAAGWPGERAEERSAANRVHVALSSLRRLGLEELIERGPDGWCLSPTVPVRAAPAP